MPSLVRLFPVAIAAALAAPAATPAAGQGRPDLLDYNNARRLCSAQADGRAATGPVGVGPRVMVLAAAEGDDTWAIDGRTARWLEERIAPRAEVLVCLEHAPEADRDFATILHRGSWFYVGLPAARPGRRLLRILLAIGAAEPR